MSQDNVNINIQETNDIINIVSSEVTEVIDINVAETTEQVTLNITEDIIQVNVNKVTNISPVNSVNGLTGDIVLDIPTATSDLTNDSGFITAAEVPTVNDATASVKGILKLTNDLGGTADLPTVPGLATKGDMFKSTYDVDNTGVVDNAEAIKIIGRNSTGSTLYKGTVVYLNGATGNRPNFAKAQANAESTSAGTFGVIVDDLPNNTDGYCIALGYLDNLDTRSNATNPFTTDTLVAGDTIYLSPTNAGYITNVKPSAPNHLVYLGKVTRTSPTNGTIVYRIQNGYELEELHNVAISSVANYDGIFYNSATSLWENKNVSQVLPERRNANKSTDNNVNYCGMANKGSSEASAVWTIKRLTIGTSGSITISTATNVAWTNRESAIYI